MITNLNEKYFSKLEIAILLNVSKETISQYLNSGILKGYAFGDRVVILQRDLLKYLDDYTDSDQDLIQYLEESCPTTGNQSRGYCPRTGKPLTERDFISYGQDDYQEENAMV